MPEPDGGGVDDGVAEQGVDDAANTVFGQAPENLAIASTAPPLEEYGRSAADPDVASCRVDNRTRAYALRSRIRMSRSARRTISAASVAFA